ncbi:MAG: outer membrane beta-barrel family protein [Porphyromonas sp.]|nr:outer membrane beta-barrel family protein [Porphyromonas sp.]
MGGVVGTEEMWGGKDNFRFGGYGSLLYNHRGLFASIAPSINFNGSKHLEQQEYQAEELLYQVRTPSSGRYNYRGIRGNIQYEYGDKDLIGLALSWNKKTYDNQFESKEILSTKEVANRVVNNQNTFTSGEPRFTATAYWETAFGQRGNQIWTELSYFHLSNNSQTDYAGREHSSQIPFLAFTEYNDLNTSGLNLNNDYAFYLDADRKYLLEAGIKGSWTITTNFRAHDESKSIGASIHQKNNIRWSELIVTPYVSTTLQFNKQWWIRLGLRYVGTKSHLRQEDKTSTTIPEVSRYDDLLLPTFHASYRPSSHHQMTLTLNSSIAHPKFRDLNPFEWQINEHSFYKGNTTLHPQQYYTGSLGYTFRNALSIRGRIKRGVGLITSLSTMKGDKVYTQVENAQNSLFWGVEAGYYFDKLSWMNAGIDGYYGRNRYTSTNQFLLPETKGNEWGMSGYLDFTFNKSRTWTGYLSGEYIGRKHTTVATIEPQYDLGVGMSYFMLNRRLSLSVAGISLLSSKYKGVSHRQGYSISFDNRFNYPTLYVSVSYKFSNAKDKSTSRSHRATQEIERRF